MQDDILDKDGTDKLKMTVKTDKSRLTENKDMAGKGDGAPGVMEIRKLLFLLPALLTSVLVLTMLPRTQADLRPIPEKLSLLEDVSADTPTPEPVKKENPIKKKKKTQKNTPAADGNFTDGIYTGSSRGYGGIISVQVTVQDGQITEVAIKSAPGETEPYFSLGKTVIESLIQNQSWEVDAVSGATYTSRGILGAVKNAITGETVENASPPAANSVGTVQQEAYKDPDTYKDGTYSGSARGFGGTITVEVVVSKGKISSVKVVSAPGETKAFLDRAKSVIQDILRKNSPNVDAVSGATYSSTGIINAVKRALAQDATDSKTKKETTEKKDKKSKKKEKNEDPAAYKDGTYTGEAEGFGGRVRVKVVIKGGKIKKLTVVKADGETKEYLKLAKAVISSILKKGSPEVDAVSGATYSSTAIINAVRNALKKAAKTPASDTQDPKGENEEKKEKEEKEENEDKDGGSGSDPDNTGDNSEDDGPDSESEAHKEPFLADGVYTGTGEGFRGPISVQVTISGEKISEITILSAEDETPRFLEKAKEVVTDVLQRQSAEVDTVSGATFSSKGILTAIKNALEAAEKAAGQGEEDASGGKDDQPDGEGNENPGGEEGDELAGDGSGSEDGGSAGEGGQGGDTSSGEGSEGGDGSGSTGGQGGGASGDEGEQSGDPSGDEGEQPGNGEGENSGSGHSSGGEMEDVDGVDYVFADGTYSATGWCIDAYNEVEYELTVFISVEDQRIQRVEVTFGEDRSAVPDENDWYIGRALNGRPGTPGIPAAIVEKQSAEVDTISGATFTSRTLIALADAILSEIRSEKPKEAPNQGEEAPGDSDGKPTDEQEHTADGGESGQADGTQAGGKTDGQADGTQAGGKTDGQADGIQAGGKTDGQADGTQAGGKTDGQADGTQAGDKANGQSDGENENSASDAEADKASERSDTPSKEDTSAESGGEESSEEEAAEEPENGKNGG